MRTIIIFVIVLLVLLIGSLILRGVFPRTHVKTMVEGPFSLSKTEPLGKTQDLQDAFLRSGTGTIQAFVYILPYQRTSHAVVCSSGNLGDPLCGSDGFQVCSCNGSDCSNCSHKGFHTLLNLSRSLRLEILNAPDASRPNSAYAQLVARTSRRSETGSQMTATQVTEETFRLPAIPFQKWTMITIAREGRRVDVFYNDEIVLSKRAQNMLDTAVMVAPLTAGSDVLAGKIGKVRFFERRLGLPEVKTSYQQLANTKGEPHFSDLNFSKLVANLNPCPDGKCFSSISVHPPSGLAEFRSSYS
jgi:hypothetical protein